MLCSINSILLNQYWMIIILLIKMVKSKNVILIVKYCGSKKVIKKDFNWRILYLESGLAVKVKIKRYECNDCKRKCQSEFSKYYNKYCNFSNNIKNKAKRLLQHGWKSLRNLKNDFKELLSLNISYESIRKYIFCGDSLYWCDEESELSGYFGYDAQWVMLKGKWWYRLDIFDTIRNTPVAYQISNNESNRIVKNFINKSIPLKYRKADSNMIQNKDMMK